MDRSGTLCQTKVREQLLEPGDFSAGLGKGNVLRLGGREGGAVLGLGGPAEGTTAKESYLQRVLAKQ